ncbi:MAG: IS5 family transposase [Actinomycetota bacterium]|nr:IS5 family transposase [Actinomycetota bacterium]
MRGSTMRQLSMLSAVTPDELVPTLHPIRRVRPMVDQALESLAPTFEAMYAEGGRPSIPPEHLLKGCLLMALYSIRSERQFCERLQYDLLFKWFLGLNLNDAAFDHSSFAKNRRRLLDHAVSRAFFEAVLVQARQQHLLSNDHFTLDGTLLESWASLKSFQRKPNLGGQRKPKRGRPGGGPPAGVGGGRNPEVNFREERRSNQTHYSATDPEARLARKGHGREAKLCLAGHVLMENRSGLVVDVELNSPSGNAEREAGLKMLRRYRKGRRRLTLGGDKGYDTRDFVAGCRELRVTPHVAQNQSGRRSAIDGRTVGQLGYLASQRLRKRVEEIFGWWKTVAGGRKLRYVGVRRNQLWAELSSAAYNLVRMANLCPVPA